MFKVVILLRRKEEKSSHEFRNWWIGKHAVIARQLPGLKKLYYNMVDSENALYDGIAKLWFDSKEDFEEAYKTAIIHVGHPSNFLWGWKGLF